VATAGDKRRHARHPLVLAVTWPGGGPDGDRTEDVSDGGLFIRRKPVNYQDIVATVRTLLTAWASPELRLALAGRGRA